MKRDVNIIDEKEVFKKAIFRIVEARLQFERYDGRMSEEIVRLNLDRGDSAAALVHDRDDDVLVMTEQFRYATLHGGSGWITELPAGMVDEGERPAEAMVREICEEIGYHVASLHPIATFYVSPGGTSERIHLYYSAVDGEGRKSEGGGVEGEGEDIRVVRQPVEEALEDLAAGRVTDAKTIIALQWLVLHRNTL